MSGLRNGGKVSFFQVTYAIGKVTFLEVLREKVLYNVLLIAILLFSLGFFASRITYIQPERMILDFGYLALSFSSLILGILIGASLIPKEFERRTAHVALSHPISTYQFIFGKYLGLVQVLAVNWVLLVTAYILLLFGQKGVLDWSSLGFTFFSAIWLALVQSFLVGAIAIVFSSFSTASLSVILSSGIYLIGVNASDLRLLSTRLESTLGKALLKAIANSIPNFEHFNLGLKVTYDLPVLFNLVLATTVYGFCIALFCAVLAAWFIRRRM